MSLVCCFSLSYCIADAIREHQDPKSCSVIVAWLGDRILIQGNIRGLVGDVNGED